MPETIKRSFILSCKQLAFLEKEATRLGVTVSDLLRRIIDDHRERKSKPNLVDITLTEKHRKALDEPIETVGGWGDASHCPQGSSRRRTNA